MHLLPLLGKHVGSFVEVTQGGELVPLFTEGGVPAANPYPLDAGGYLPGLYVEAGVYTAVFRSSTGLLWRAQSISVPELQITLESEPFAELWSYDKDTFSSPKPLVDELDVELPNPIVLNAEGDLPYDAFFKDGEQYTLLLVKDGRVLSTVST